MGYDPSGPFVTSFIEMKLDQSMMFEWQKRTQESSNVPHYTEMLQFIDLRARTSEAVFRKSPKLAARAQKGQCANGPVAYKLRYFNNMQIKRDVTSVVLLQPSCTAYVWRAMEITTVFELRGKLELIVSTKFNTSEKSRIPDMYCLKRTWSIGGSAH